MNTLSFLILVIVFCFYVESASYKRGSCLSMCGPYGVKCPDGYDCNSNGCGSECYRSANYQMPVGCTEPQCDYHCPLGFQTDANGCDTCRCDYTALHTVG